MSLSKKEVEHIAALARIRITEEEKELFSKQLSSILDYVNQLKDIDTKNVKELARIAQLDNVLRKDEIQNCPREARDAILQNAEEVEDDLIKTKSVFE